MPPRDPTPRDHCGKLQGEPASDPVVAGHVQGTIDSCVLLAGEVTAAAIPFPSSLTADSSFPPPFRFLPASMNPMKPSLTTADATCSC